MTNKPNKKFAKRVTQLTVAQIAGVSTAVVSAVLNPNAKGEIRVGRETAERVRAVVKQLGYTPNPIAQSLAKGRSNILGVFTYEPTFPSDRGNFFYPILHGIEMEMSDVGRDLLLFTSAQATNKPRTIYSDGSNRLGVSDGVILLGQEPDAEELVQLNKAGFPFVTIGRRSPEGIELNWVGAGYVDATRALVNLGYKNGHRNIALLSCAIVREQQEDRKKGYLQGIQQFGLPLHQEWQLNVNANEISEDWIHLLITQNVTLILAETLEHALQIERVAKQLGHSIPNDISIAVLGAPMAETNAIGRWTRFRIPRENIGREAVKILVGLLDGKLQAPVQVTLPCDVVEGTTLLNLAHNKP